MRVPPLVFAALLSFRAASQEPALAAEPGVLDSADRLWRQRAEGSTGGTARTGAIEPVLEACRRAIKEDPGSLEARWRLMRALYFQGEHTTSVVEDKKRIFDEGRKVGEDALAIVRQLAAKDGQPADKATPVELVPRVKGVPGAADCFFWTAVDWGKWALAFGKGAAIRQGAAAKIRDYAQAVVLLDPKLEDGGGYRVLGRLHHQTPSVPFFTGWASRREALKNLRLAVDVAPKNFINRLYLAEALWDYESAEREKARSMLKAIVADTPLPDHLVEDRKAQEDAAALLKSWEHAQ